MLGENATLLNYPSRDTQICWLVEHSDLKQSTEMCLDFARPEPTFNRDDVSATLGTDRRRREHLC